VHGVSHVPSSCLFVAAVARGTPGAARDGAIRAAYAAAASA